MLEEIKECINMQMSVKEISEELNTNEKKIYKILKENNFKTKYVKKKWRRNNFVKIVENYNNYTEICKALNVTPYGAGYRQVKKYIKMYNLDISHFKIKVTSKNKLSNDEIFVINSKCTSSTVRKRIITENLIEYKCSNDKCDVNKTWLEMPITLHLDHINGDRTDNRLSNLRFLCPNCHQQTSTWGGKNINERIEIVYVDKNNEKIIKQEKICLHCKKNVINKKNEKFCSHSCYYKHQEKNVPSKEELLSILKEKNGVFLRVGKHYNVSDNGVRKWCKKHNIPYKKNELKEYLKNH